MRIVFDLDGVFRELNAYLNSKYGVPYPEHWFWTFQGKDIFDWIKEHGYKPLVYSPATRYLLAAQKAMEGIEIWTNQPEEWKPYTVLWLEANFGGRFSYSLKYLNTEQKRAELDRCKDTYLVEDCPQFSSYDRILLIDRPYNRHIDAIRITKPQELKEWIQAILNQESSTTKRSPAMICSPQSQ